MRIPRFAFAVLIAGVLILASALVVGKARARDTGSVVMLTTAGPNGLLFDCPLSTQGDSHDTCSWFGNMGTQKFAYKVTLLSRDGDRLRFAIRTRTYRPGEDLSAFTRDADPGARVKEAWFEPGEPLKFDVPGIGTLTLKGDWLDHMPIMGLLDPGQNELRLGRPLLLKDKKVVGDLADNIGAYYSQDTPDWAMDFYIPGEGRFYLAELPMQGAVEAHVAFSRISFEEGGHSWELVSGVPVCRADHVWVLHQPDYKPKTTGRNGDQVGFGNAKLVQTEPGVWVPQDRSGRQ